MSHEAGLDRKVLMVAYYFPPYGSVGFSIRAVKFVKFLPDFGWEPVVLTIEDRGNCNSLAARLSLDEIPPATRIHRAVTREWIVRAPAGYAEAANCPPGLNPSGPLRRTLRPRLPPRANGYVIGWWSIEVAL